MATYLDRLIDYDTWANQGLLDFLAHRIWVHGDDWPPDQGPDRRE